MKKGQIKLRKIKDQLIEPGYDIKVIDREGGIMLTLPMHQGKASIPKLHERNILYQGVHLFLASKVIFSSCCYYIYLDSTFFISNNHYLFCSISFELTKICCTGVSILSLRYTYWSMFNSSKSCIHVYVVYACLYVH